ncbi:MAG: dihydroorotase [Bacteroidia bacterium]|nr:dihydroorotase [Bacteroidia bacterium]
MKVLLKSATIIDPNSAYHKQTKDILIRKGKIEKIANTIKADKVRLVESPNLHVSLGWLDLQAYFCDPGYEFKEDINSGIEAASFGGYTAVCVLPDTFPVTQSKSEIEYILSKGKNKIVDVLPLGAISQNLEGVKITEIYDMHEAGAVAFSDGRKPLSAGMLERSLLYVKPFHGIVFSHPEESTLSKDGLMHEGATSASMGVKGAPSLAEEVAVLRDLHLTGYTGSRLHFINISTRKSVEFIREAKSKGIEITASVNAYNLILDEKAVADFDTNLKVRPHLRSMDDIAALHEGLRDGTIDTITSSHNPQDEESKKVEFDHAEFGMIGLETCFGIARTSTKKHFRIEKLIDKLAYQPRHILKLPIEEIKNGGIANLTIFDPDLEWTFTEKHIRSKSRNTPFIGHDFVGKAIGIINNNKLYLAEN